MDRIQLEFRLTHFDRQSMPFSQLSTMTNKMDKDLDGMYIFIETEKRFLHLCHLLYNMHLVQRVLCRKQQYIGKKKIWKRGHDEYCLL